MSSSLIDENDIIREGQGELIPQAIICDLDGTIALLGSRHWSETDLLMGDKLNHFVYRLLVKYKKDGYKIIIWTERPMSSSQETMKWLDMQGVPFDTILMNDHIIPNIAIEQTFKHKLYEQYIQGRYDVEFIIDDKYEPMFRFEKLGINCLQVYTPGVN